MRKSVEFMTETRGMSTDDLWQAVVRYAGEPYPNQLAPEGTSVVIVFPDHTSVFANDLKSGHPRVEIRS